jgi:hypothetical protein
MLERIGARPGVLDRAMSRIASAWFLSASCRLDRAGGVVTGPGEKLTDPERHRGRGAE